MDEQELCRRFTPPIFAAAAKAKIAAVSSSKGNVASDTILVPKDSPLRTVSDLRGKTIGVAKGSSTHGQILYTLGRAGLSTKDSRLSFLQPADAYGAFNQHQLDAWVVWDPYTSQARLESGARVLADGRGTANGYAFIVAGTDALADPGVNTALRDYGGGRVAQRRASCARFLASLDRWLAGGPPTRRRCWGVDLVGLGGDDSLVCEEPWCYVCVSRIETSGLRW